MSDVSVAFPPAYPIRLLIADDSARDAELMVAALRREGYSLTYDLVDSPSAFQEKLETREYDVVLCDHNLGSWTGHDAFKILRRLRQDTQFIVVTAALGDEAAVEYVKMGAADYVLKDRLERLPTVVWHILREKHQREVNTRLKAERKKLEAQFLQAQKMEAVGRLAGGVAHDFNNLMGIILGYGELVLGQDNLNAGTREQIGYMMAGAKTAASLTKQLLAFGGKQMFIPKIFSLNDIVAETEKMLKRLIGEDIKLETRLNASPALMRADPTQIQQVLMNLAVNARDAMPAGGRLLIETSNVTNCQRELYTEAGGRVDLYILLSATDNGCGMDSKVMSHLFEPFFTTKEKGKGTGLGLSTVFGIVNQSGGKIAVTSKPGQGAVFRLYFPVAEKLEPEHHLTQSHPRVAGSETILLVEDEAILRQVLRMQLEFSGYHVLESTSPENAVEIATTFEVKIDLLLTDVVMPGMSGTEVAARVRRIRPEMRVLYITGYYDKLTDGATFLDPSVLLQKPFTREELVRKIQEVLSSPLAVTASHPAVA